MYLHFFSRNKVRGFHTICKEFALKYFCEAGESRTFVIPTYQKRASWYRTQTVMRLFRFCPRRPGHPHHPVQAQCRSAR